jgi:tetratricopeptide (TPR) repeat protein
MSEKTLDQALNTYAKLLELYPEDFLGNMSLANVYMWLDEWDKAIELSEANRKRKDPNSELYVMLAWAYASKGLPEKARDILEECARDFSDNKIVHGSLSMIYAEQGQYDLALGEANKAFSLAPTDPWIHEIFGEIYIRKGDFLAAEKEYLKIPETSRSSVSGEGSDLLTNLYLLEGKFGLARKQIQQGLTRSAGKGYSEFSLRCALGSLLQKSGDYAAALEELEKAWSWAVKSGEQSDQRAVLWLRGLAEIGTNSIPKAQRTAEDLKALVEKGIFKKAIRYYHHLQGSIEQAKKNYSQANEYLKKAVSSQGRAVFYDALASAYFRAGDLANAQKNYEAIISLPAGRLKDGDIYAKSYYMLGKIAEQQGQKTKAVEHYQKFLDLWKAADAGQPEVENAKARLAIVEGSGPEKK